MRRIILMAFALLVLSPAMVRASVLYQCASGDEVRTSCCCPAAAKHHDTGGARPSLHPTCCCKITQIEAREASARAAPPAPFAIATHAIAARLAVVLPVRLPRLVASLAAQPPPRGPPSSLLALRCALLL